MIISPAHRHFLCLHRLESEHLQILATNLKKFAHFRISDCAVLICTDITNDLVLAGIASNLPIGSVSILMLGGAGLIGLNAKRETFGLRVQTVYTEPEQNSPATLADLL